MADDNFYEAAIRHWIDGKILEEQEEYDNSVCMQGFAAECALKAILQVGYPDELVIKYNHFGIDLFQDIEMHLLGDMTLAAVMDPACGLRLSQISLPEILFKKHPERRYYRDGVYSKGDVGDCRAAVDSMMKELSRLHLDGYF